MAKLTVNGVKVTVDDSFLGMTPEQQEATVNEIAASLPKAKAPQSKPISFEEGQKLLEQEELGGRWGELGAGLTSAVEGIPVAGPYLLKGVQKAAAGISSATGGGSYEDNLKEAERITNVAQTENPIASTAGQVAGGVIGTAPLVAAAPAAFGAGTASLPARMLAGGTSGGVIGGADAAVRSGGDMGETAKGALIGGGLGLAGPFLADKAGDAYRAFSTRSAQNEAARLAGTNRPAVDVVSRALASDNAIGATNANIAGAGPRGMLADAGPSTLSVLDTAIQRGGPQAGTAARRIGERASGATDDIVAALNRGLGQPQGMVRPLDELRTATAPARAAAYDAAYATPINYADESGQALEKLIKERVPASVIDRANRLMRVNGEESQQILAKVADDGTVAFERLPDVRQVDYIKRALDDVSRAGDGAGALGGNTAEGRAYGNLARELRDTLSGLVPEYKTALKTAAEPIAQREATLFGQKLLSPSVARDEVDDFVSGLTDAQVTALRGGIRSKFDEMLANVTRTASDPNVDAREGVKALRDLSSKAARDKLSTVMGPEEAGKMFDAVDQAARSFELRAGVSSNSKTYARQAAERAVEQATAPGIVETAASGKPLAGAQGIMQALLRTSPQNQLARQDAAWGEIANLLTQPADQGRSAVVQALMRASQQVPVVDQRTNAIVQALTRGGAVSSTPANRLLREGSR